MPDDSRPRPSSADEADRSRPGAASASTGPPRSSRTQSSPPWRRPSTASRATEAARRLERDGPNELGARGRTLARGAASRSCEARCSGCCSSRQRVSIGVGERTSGGIILGIMALSVGLGFFNEFRSEQTLASLRERTGRRATVLRDGAPTELPAAGARPRRRLPAPDRRRRARPTCACSACSELTVDEATLSGEPYPVEKQVAAVDAPAGGVHANCAYMGTIVRSGRGLRRRRRHRDADAARRGRRRPAGASAADRVPARPDVVRRPARQGHRRADRLDLRHQRRCSAIRFSTRCCSRWRSRSA